MTFTLLGHDAPTGEYPATVVPVGERDGALAVCWRTADGVEFETVRADAEFVRHALAGFDAVRDALFAFSPDDVVSYPISDEAVFFDAVLQDPRMAEADPFFRLDLAIAAGHEDLISAELVRARRRMAENAPDYTSRWYEETLARLGAEWTARAEELLEHEATPLPASPRAVLAGLTLAERTFEREAARLRNVLARSSGNGKVEQLDDLRRLVTADVTLVLAGDDAPEIGAHLNVPGTRIDWIDAREQAPTADGVLLLGNSAAPAGAAGAHRLALPPRLDVPALAADAGWLRRVDSGMAELEERIARFARDRVRLPRLRYGLDRASAIGTEHLTALRRDRKNVEITRDEYRVQMELLTRDYSRRLERVRVMERRCLEIVSYEVKHGHISFFARERSVTALAARCDDRIRAEMRDFPGVSSSVHELLRRSTTDADLRDRLRLVYGKAIRESMERIVEETQAELGQITARLQASIGDLRQRDSDLQELLHAAADSLHGLHALGSSLNAGSLYLPDGA